MTPLKIAAKIWHRIIHWGGHRYNIGLINSSLEDLIQSSKSAKSFKFANIIWIQNTLTDRWYADPFILSVESDSVIILAEEQIERRPGRLVALTIDRTSGEILNLKVILDLKTHLSYPQILSYHDETYVIPENGAAGKVSLYRMTTDLKLEFVKDLIIGQYYDTTIFHDDAVNKWYMIATDSTWQAYLFSSNSLFGEWKQTYTDPIIIDKRYSRNGGAIFMNSGIVYRVAQDCKRAYGNSLHIMKVHSFEPFSESEILHISPYDKRYKLGIHTLNYSTHNVGVIDGLSYNRFILGPLLAPILNLFLHVTANFVSYIKLSKSKFKYHKYL